MSERIDINKSPPLPTDRPPAQTERSPPDPTTQGLDPQLPGSKVNNSNTTQGDRVQGSINTEPSKENPSQPTTFETSFPALAATSFSNLMATSQTTNYTNTTKTIPNTWANSIHISTKTQKNGKINKISKNKPYVLSQKDKSLYDASLLYFDPFIKEIDTSPTTPEEEELNLNRLIFILDNDRRKLPTGAPNLAEISHLERSMPLNKGPHVLLQYYLDLPDNNSTLKLQVHSQDHIHWKRMEATIKIIAKEQINSLHEQFTELNQRLESKRQANPEGKYDLDDAPIIAKIPRILDQIMAWVYLGNCKIALDKAIIPQFFFGQAAEMLSYWFEKNKPYVIGVASDSILKAINNILEHHIFQDEESESTFTLESYTNNPSGYLMISVKYPALCDAQAYFQYKILQPDDKIKRWIMDDQPPKEGYLSAQATVELGSDILPPKYLTFGLDHDRKKLEISIYENQMSIINSADLSDILDAEELADFRMRQEARQQLLNTQDNMPKHAMATHLIETTIIYCPKYCQYCHLTSHTFSSCSKRGCSLCHNRNHPVAKCPQRCHCDIRKAHLPGKCDEIRKQLFSSPPSSSHPTKKPDQTLTKPPSAQVGFTLVTNSRKRAKVGHSDQSTPDPATPKASNQKNPFATLELDQPENEDSSSSTFSQQQFTFVSPSRVSSATKPTTPRRRSKSTQREISLPTPTHSPATPRPKSAANTSSSSKQESNTPSTPSFLAKEASIPTPLVNQQPEMPNQQSPSPSPLKQPQLTPSNNDHHPSPIKDPPPTNKPVHPPPGIDQHSDLEMDPNSDIDDGQTELPPSHHRHTEEEPTQVDTFNWADTPMEQEETSSEMIMDFYEGKSSSQDSTRSPQTSTDRL